MHYNDPLNNSSARGKDNDSAHPLWGILCGLGVMIGAVWLWFLFYEMETSNGTMRIHFFFAWLYNLGGKWLATSVLGLIGLLLFSMGVRNIVIKK